MTSETPRLNLVELHPRAKARLGSVARLHMELLGFGPMAGLGERFIREAIYAPHVRDGSLTVATCEIDGEAVGFIAYTDRSADFHRGSLRRHWMRVGGVLLGSLLEDPRRLARLARALLVLRSRRGEERRVASGTGEVVCVAVRQRYLTAAFQRRTGCRISEALIVHAARALAEAGVREMRMLVDAGNKAVLMLYHLLGARFEPYEQAGEPMVEVWFDVADLAARSSVAEPVPQRERVSA